ncbi:MAG: acyl-ACP--UDP-N- acetylglucosamine O-acyltransferase [Jatrophihabitans sp.]
MLSSAPGRTAHPAREILMNNVHPSAVIGADVEMGDGNVVGPYVVIVGPVRLGNHNWIGPHVVIGTPAEIRGIDHGPDIVDTTIGTGVTIGNGNTVREFTTIHQGHYATTTVGDDCYLMNKVYIGHDGAIGDGVTMAAGVTLGGHVHVGPGANLGMGATVHQRRVIGPLAMVGMGAVVTHDVPPYALGYGSPCRVHGANRVGMQRAGLAESTVESVHAHYLAGGSAQQHSDPACRDAWSWWETTLGQASR